jgi:Cu2+-exporting ATPase
MKTSVIEVHDMLSVLTVDEVEKRFGEVPGVASATVNYAARNATVRYDETLLEVADIKILVHQRGQHSAGESQDKDVSEDKPAQKPGVNPTPEAAPASSSPPEPAVPKAAPAAAPKPAVPVGEGPPGKEAPAAPPSTPVAAKEE